MLYNRWKGNRAENYQKEFSTNNFNLPALTIARLYRSRWQVEQIQITGMSTQPGAATHESSLLFAEEEIQ